MNVASAHQVVSSLYEEWYSSLLVYVCRMLGSRAEAEEVVQEAFLLLYRRCRKSQAPDNPKGWTLRLARRLAWKRRSVHTSQDFSDGYDLAQLPTYAPNPEQLMMASQISLDRFVAQLTTREVEVVLLRLDGLRYREIATALHISTSSVNTLLARALVKLRRAISLELGEEAAAHFLEEAHS